MQELLRNSCWHTVGCDICGYDIIDPIEEMFMKNRGKVLIAMVIMTVLLAACGIRSVKDATSGEMAVPEVSSEDLLVSSLEYLLLDDDEEDISYEQPAQTEDDVQGDEAVVYYGDGGSIALKQETIGVEAVTPDELINSLAKHNIVSLDTKVLSFEQEEEDGSMVLRLDLSKSAGEYLRTMSKEAECIIVAAVVNTFLENYDADEIYILVDGKALVTSNAAYTEALAQCTPGELLEMLSLADSEDNEAGVTDDSDDEVACNLPLAAEETED